MTGKGNGRMGKWWDRLWGAVWIIGSVAIAYLTGHWFATHAAPADLGGLRYGLIAFAGIFGWLLGAFVLSLAIIGVTIGLESLCARLGYPIRPPATPATTDAAKHTLEVQAGPLPEGARD